jgi:hypothetical protein
MENPQDKRDSQNHVQYFFLNISGLDKIPDAQKGDKRRKKIIQNINHRCHRCPPNIGLVR